LTAQKRAEADRLIVSKLESTGILAGGVAHDFNNLLTVLLLDLEMVRLSEPSGSEAKEWLDDAKQAIARAQALTTQLITFADGGAPVRKPACLSDFVRASVRQGVDGSALTTSFTVADDLWWVQVDSDQFAQVIRNLVANAREAMPHGGPLSIRLDNVVWDGSPGLALPAGRYVRFSLTDRGGGIAAEVLPKIFDPYFSTKARGQQKGMGLGLTICHAIVRKHGGAITALTEPGVGATFQIYLPACEPGTGKAK
jgi:signal transduction histidine kinase